MSDASWEKLGEQAIQGLVTIALALIPGMWMWLKMRAMMSQNTVETVKAKNAANAAAKQSQKNADEIQAVAERVGEPHDSIVTELREAKASIEVAKVETMRLNRLVADAVHRKAKATDDAIAIPPNL